MPDPTRYRRRVVGAGGVAAFAVFVIGAPIFNNRIENDLERRVPAALAAAGFDGLQAKFSGQDGRLTCPGPLADPERALAVARDVRGVYSVELDRGCRVNTLGNPGAPAAVTTGSTALTTPDSESTPTTAPASVEAPPETVASGPSVVAALADGRLTVTGPGADEAARAVLILAATVAVGADRFDDRTTIEPGGIDADTAAQLASLITALEAELLTGEAGLDGTGLYLHGTYANSADAARATAAAELAGAVTELAPRPRASGEQASALEIELNELVAERPITFGQGSAVLDDSAVAIIDALAARLLEFDGLEVVVEGHTDSDGAPATNQALSEQRAGAVAQALIERGVTPDSISSEGFGSQRPVLSPSGIEDKTASRRVEFRISTR